MGAMVDRDLRSPKMKLAACSTAWLGHIDLYGRFSTTFATRQRKPFQNMQTLNVVTTEITGLGKRLA